MPSSPDDIIFFSSADDMFSWLLDNHDKASELIVGFYNKAAGGGQTGISYKEAMEEALCFGWTNTLIKKTDERTYMVRFTPRKPNGIWSVKTVKKVQELIAEERMHPAGLAAFEARNPGKTAKYSYENKPKELSPEYENALRGNSRAWAFFQSQPPSYRKTAIYWIMSAAREETRLKRLDALIRDSEDGLRVGPLRRR